MKIGEKNYALFLAIGFFSAFAGFSVGLIPYIGYVLASLFGFIVLLGELRMYKKILNHETVNFESFLNLVFDPVVFNKLQPYLIVVFVMSLLETLLLHSGLKFMNVTLIVPTVIVSLCGFAALSEIEKDIVNPIEAIKFIFKGLWQNVISCIVCLLLVLLFCFVCAVACFIPLFLYAMPMLLAVKYLVYAAIFENLDVEQTLAEWTAIVDGPKVAPPVEPPAL
jgi:hypothetical protein